MNLFTTIFGGMLLTAILYGLGRLARLSNFWSAVLAAALPAFAYLGLALVQRPGLDVITIHVIAFPTVAVLLSQLYGAKANHRGNLHWAPKLMIAFFAAISLLYGGFVYVAGNGLPPAIAERFLPDAMGKQLHTGFAGVVEHHAEAAKGIGQHLRMEAKLAELGWNVEVAGLEGIRSGAQVPIAVRVSDRGGNSVPDIGVSITLARPGQEETHSVALSGGHDGYYATLPTLDSGHWVATIRLATGTERVALEHTIEVR